ncbi:hypothetical protein SAMN04487949_3056 [Halogranum gelatinilyticum]|uniref:Uncharacterized protein n=1 Tax=Halogranum gelatinilyticum TaxID=660521 RepID=A0A1G9XMK3_9EURY|nr:hypothetical protein [Halogranum gelatinilyticum]SDM98079.1 hypothetical protein SAMN04487949_3056 [Halogranum gelatinilyticum]
MNPSNGSRPRLVGTVAALLAGTVGLVAFPTGPLFALVFGLVTGVAGWTMARRWDVWGASGNRWSGALAGLVTATAFLGVQGLPLALGHRLALSLLLISVGYASAGLAVEFAVDVENRPSDGDESRPTPGSHVSE